MTDEIRFVGDLTRIDKRPGDVWVLHCNEIISAETAVTLTRYIRHALGDPEAKVVVMDPALKLSVVSECA